MDLGTVVERLYAGSPDDFIAARKGLAAQARGAKDRDLARQIEALRKPTRSAWLVNMLARHEADDLAQLLDLAPALAEAHTGGDAASLRELSQLKRQVVSALAQQAVDLGSELGHESGPATVDEVATILEAALTQPDVAEQVRAGRVTAPPASASAFPLGLLESLSAARPLAPVVPLPVREGEDDADDDGPEDAEDDDPDAVEAEDPADVDPVAEDEDPGTGAEPDDEDDGPDAVEAEDPVDGDPEPGPEPAPREAEPEQERPAPSSTRGRPSSRRAAERAVLRAELDLEEAQEELDLAAEALAEAQQAHAAARARVAAAEKSLDAAREGVTAGQ